MEPANETTPISPTDTAPATPAEPVNSGELVESEDLKKIIETLLFITDRPVKPSRLAEVAENTDARRVREIIHELQEEFAAQNRAVQIVEIAGGFQMATKAEYGRWVRRLYNEKMTTKLSNAALETLAIIAYKQPITRAEMEAIRGVDVAGPLERLLERSLVRVVGKKDTIGRPMVYGTTDEFLRLFGLNKIAELPDLQTFAAKTLQEKQEDLPFGEPLPPVGEPAIIPLDELPAEERLQALEAAPDPFFKRNSYNRGDFFGTPEIPAAPAAKDASAAQTAAEDASAAQTAAQAQPAQEAQMMQDMQDTPSNQTNTQEEEK